MGFHTPTMWTVILNMLQSQIRCVSVYLVETLKKAVQFYLYSTISQQQLPQGTVYCKIRTLQQYCILIILIVCDNNNCIWLTFKYTVKNDQGNICAILTLIFALILYKQPSKHCYSILITKNNIQGFQLEYFIHGHQMCGLNLPLIFFSSVI